MEQRVRDHHGSDLQVSGLEQRQARLLGRGLFAGAVLCVVGSGLLLWGRYGGAVFNDMVVAALAWCF